MMISIERCILSLFLIDSLREINNDVTDFKLLSSIADELRENYDISYEGQETTDSVYLFVYNSIIDFKFKQFSSIEEAIKSAVNYIEDVKIICKGKVIKWDILNENTLFYIHPTNNKIYTVNLGGINNEKAKDNYTWITYNT